MKNKITLFTALAMLLLSAIAFNYSSLSSEDLSFNNINFSIRTDKTNYFDNDTIKVYIFPNDLFVNLTYGNQSVIARNYTEFQAVLYENKIYTKAWDNEQVVLVNVNNKKDFDILWELCALLFIGYICYKGIKVYGSKILEAI